MVFSHAISWFEIPTKDIERAAKFYEEIFEIKLVPIDVAQVKMRMFPIENPMNIGGALVYNKEFYRSSSTDGPLIYLNANPDVQIILDRVVKAGGTIVVPKTQISPEHGYMAVMIDTEGNRIAFHSIP